MNLVYIAASKNVTFGIINILIDSGWSAFFYAVTNPNSLGNGNKSIIRALFIYGAEIDTKNHAYKTSLLYAISQSAIK
ncbi:unnamed protein product [Penicillium salamii]|nr:unnamed protein product [Penicillium salamii]